MTRTQHQAALDLNTFDLGLHNGVVTAFNPQTGGHATYRIRTVRKGALKGKRVVELLTGSDNENDYRPFGFVIQHRLGPTVRVWRKYRGERPDQKTAWERHADVLTFVHDYAYRRGIEFLASGTCRRCNRTLSDPTSIQTGMGPECRTRGQL